MTVVHSGAFVVANNNRALGSSMVVSDAGALISFLKVVMILSFHVSYGGGII